MSATDPGRDPATLDATLPTHLGGDGPLVSVVLPTYEDSEYLPTAIESVADQRHGNLECLVVDGSDVGWLAELAADRPWLTHVVQEPDGVSAARNEGIDRATGEILAFLDADDWWHPARLERQLPALESAGIVYADHYVVDADGTHHQPAMPVTDPDDHYVEYFRRGDGVPSRTVAVRRDCLGEARFDESLRAREDPHLWVRLFERCRPARVAEPLAYKRRRADSLTADPTAMYESECAEIADLCERYPELAAYRAEREGAARVRYGKGLLNAGRRRAARRTFIEAFRTRPTAKAGVLAGVAALPVGSRWAFARLERVVDRLRAG